MMDGDMIAYMRAFLILAACAAAAVYWMTARGPFAARKSESGRR